MPALPATSASQLERSAMTGAASSAARWARAGDASGPDAPRAHVDGPGGDVGAETGAGNDGTAAGRGRIALREGARRREGGAGGGAPRAEPAPASRRGPALDPSRAQVLPRRAESRVEMWWRDFSSLPPFRPCRVPATRIDAPAAPRAPLGGPAALTRRRGEVRSSTLGGAFAAAC